MPEDGIIKGWQPYKILTECHNPNYSKGLNNRGDIAEQTHIKNKTEQEKYFERLQTEDAYKLLMEAYVDVGALLSDDLYARIKTFLYTGILEGQYRGR